MKGRCRGGRREIIGEEEERMQSWGREEGRKEVKEVTEWRSRMMKNVDRLVFGRGRDSEAGTRLKDRTGEKLKRGVKRRGAKGEGTNKMIIKK